MRRFRLFLVILISVLFFSLFMPLIFMLSGGHSEVVSFVFSSLSSLVPVIFFVIFAKNLFSLNFLHRDIRKSRSGNSDELDKRDKSDKHDESDYGLS